MTKQELKEQIDAILDAATIEKEELSPIEYLKKNFLTINEAIIYAHENGVKLRNNAIQQFHLLCKNEKVTSTTLGENGFRLILKESLDAWIREQKTRQGNV